MTNATAAAVLTLANPPNVASVGPVVFTLKDGSGAIVSTQAVGAAGGDLTATATFTSVGPGTGYTVTAQRTDASGASVGSAAVSSPFDVIATQDVTVATGVTVSLA